MGAYIIREPGGEFQSSDLPDLRLFKEFAVEMAPKLFPTLPT